MNIVGVIGNARKRKVKRLSGSTSSSYYPSAFINKPCDQLFGPQPLDCSLNSLLHGNSNINIKSNSSSNSIVKHCLDCSNQSLNDDPLMNKSLDGSMISNGSLDVIRHATSISLSSCLSKENLHASSSSPTSSLIHTENSDASSSSCCAVSDGKFNYIPAPKWNKLQNSLLEELFRKSRYLNGELK